MNWKHVTRVHDMFCAEVEDDKFILCTGLKKLALCEEVPQGLRIIKDGIQSAIEIVSLGDFKYAVEHLKI